MKLKAIKYFAMWVIFDSRQRATFNETWIIIFNFDIVLYIAGTEVTIIPKEQTWLQFDQQQTNYIEKNTI
jgi:hypothetical protein